MEEKEVKLRGQAKFRRKMCKNDLPKCTMNIQTISSAFNYKNIHSKNKCLENKLLLLKILFFIVLLNTSSENFFNSTHNLITHSLLNF